MPAPAATSLCHEQTQWKCTHPSAWTVRGVGPPASQRLAGWVASLWVVWCMSRWVRTQKQWGRWELSLRLKEKRSVLNFRCLAFSLRPKYLEPLKNFLFIHHCMIVQFAYGNNLWYVNKSYSKLRLLIRFHVFSLSGLCAAPDKITTSTPELKGRKII